MLFYQLCMETIVVFLENFFLFKKSLKVEANENAHK